MTAALTSGHESKLGNSAGGATGSAGGTSITSSGGGGSFGGFGGFSGGSGGGSSGGGGFSRGGSTGSAGRSVALRKAAISSGVSGALGACVMSTLALPGSREPRPGMDSVQLLCTRVVNSICAVSGFHVPPASTIFFASFASSLTNHSSISVKLFSFSSFSSLAIFDLFALSPWAYSRLNSSVSRSCLFLLISIKSTCSLVTLLTLVL